MLRFVLPIALLAMPALEPVTPVVCAPLAVRAIERTEVNIGANTDPAVKKIYEVTDNNGLLWWEAEDAGGKKYVIKESSTESGVVDFNDGRGGRPCYWN